jgi:small nuclear ribonucleoprotein (snRNP)-like protein
MKGKHFEGSVVVSVKPISPNSPLAYVHKRLGRRVKMSLVDGRTLEGKLAALNSAGQLCLTGVHQTTADEIFELKTVIVPLAWIREMSVVTPIPVKPAPAAKK